MLARIEPAGQEVRQRQRHRDPDGFGDLDVRCAFRSQFPQPLGDQAGQGGEHLVDETTRLRPPAPSTVPDHPDGTPADDDVTGFGHVTAKAGEAAGRRVCTKADMFHVSLVRSAPGVSTTVWEPTVTVGPG